MNTATSTFIASPLNQSTCISCDSQVSNCLSCYYSSSAQKTICMTCSAGYYLFDNGTCTNVCPTGAISYYISQGNYCRLCVPYCNICTSDTICQSCLNGYALYQSKCISACPNGFYPLNGVCTQC